LRHGFFCGTTVVGRETRSIWARFLRSIPAKQVACRRCRNEFTQIDRERLPPRDRDYQSVLDFALQPINLIFRRYDLFRKD
jgi:hypothetical protein